MGSSETPEIFNRWPTYVVVFDSEAPIDRPAPAIVPVRRNEPNALGTVPHQLDKSLTSTLHPLWFFMHLPRVFRDMRDSNAKPLKEMQQFDLSHSVVLWPSRFVTERGELPSKPDHEICIIVATARTVDAVRRLVAQNALQATVYENSELSAEVLADEWNKMADRVGRANVTLARPLPLTEYVNNASSLLPLRWSQRQFLNWELPERTGPDDLGRRLRWVLEIQAHIDAIARMERDDRSRDEASSLMEKEVEASRRSVRFPVAVGLPGVPPVFAKRILPKPNHERASEPENLELLRLEQLKSDTLADVSIERAALEAVVSHRATARGGAGLYLNPAPTKAFRLLDGLESHCQSGKPDAKFVWKQLAQIGASFEKHFTEAEHDVIRHASMLTLFSNYPLGLITLPGDSAPLVCRLPIAMRPLLPLTRTLQTELSQPPLFYLADDLRVSIIECIPDSDPVGRASRAGWSIGLKMLEATPRTRAGRFDAKSAEEVSRIIAGERPHILFLSAHGHYDRSTNTAGIVVGDRTCFGDEFGAMPPCVIMSSCHTAPRGIGAAVFGDVLIRHGAVCMLNTLIPVSVSHNATLMLRFISYLSDCLEGNTTLRDIGEIWHHVAASNAVHDVLGCCTAAEEWGSSSLNGKPVIALFKLERSQGRIRLNHVYQDTIAVLDELAAESGILEKFRQWMRTLSYFPESLFYVMHGWPERIVLTDPTIARMQAAGYGKG
ncbi:MAG: hypothetical protein CHACPFDD_02290 [Phycisphaerae bacterium]|nr:hypothetical protein [Phycisphaerae bacterium]